jgi:HK97 family phage prohead protease
MEKKIKKNIKETLGQNVIHRKEFNFSLTEKQFEDPTSKDYYTFTGLASTFNNIDLQDDMVMPGAFTNTIKAWNKSEADLPMLWSHNREEPIGIFKEMRETDEGLEVKGYFPQKRKDDFVENRVIPQLEIGSVRSMSIGYKLDRFEIDRTGRDEYFKLLEISLREISLVVIPANPLAVITSLKAEDIKKYDERTLEEKFTKEGVKFSYKVAKAIISALKANSSRDGTVISNRDDVNKDISAKDINKIMKKFNNILGEA